jgi:hypothetical protein
VTRSRVHVALAYFGLVEPDERDRAALRGAPSLGVRRAVGAAAVAVVVLSFVLTASGLTLAGAAGTAGVFAVVGLLVALLRS